MSESAVISNVSTGAAGAVALTVSAQNSMGADSFYKASFEQIITGQFNFIVSDLLGLMTVCFLAVNIFLTVRRDIRSRKGRRDDH